MAQEEFKILVLNLTTIINTEHMKEIFGTFGSIKDVEMVKGIN